MSNHNIGALVYLGFFFLQDELYDHLDELEVTRVDKHVNDAMVWMNGKMNQQNSQDLTADPVVKVGEIKAKTKVLRESSRKKNYTPHGGDSVQVACGHGLHFGTTPLT